VFALSVTLRYGCCSVEFGHRSVHRFGKPLIVQVFKQPAFGAAPGSAGRRSCRFILAAGTGGRTDDQTLRPALMRQGPVLVPGEQIASQRNLFSEQTFRG
jgi:hypothetical protein